MTKNGHYYGCGIKNARNQGSEEQSQSVWIELTSIASIASRKRTLFKRVGYVSYHKICIYPGVGLILEGNWCRTHYRNYIWYVYH
jgi:hypothetical protein